MVQQKLAIGAGESSTRLQEGKGISWTTEGNDTAMPPDMCKRVVYMSRTHGQLAQVMSLTQC